MDIKIENGLVLTHPKASSWGKDCPSHYKEYFGYIPSLCGILTNPIWRLDKGENKTK